jgi:hypothetical protein
MSSSPAALVIFGVRQNMLDGDGLQRIGDEGDQPVLISRDIENGVRLDLISRSERLFEIDKVPEAVRLDRLSPTI